ncbi:SPOR domain-containing protein [Erwinia sp. S59]|uniref:SPOR domain-containing protein n=1 Tax=Erwinia sp. S59 TaxID=2769340 RepID=UPI00190A2E3E|nr:SPOR domain-containing protein [Erwinia sp. S59]MBK0093059.1 SPOR domain-containing protein [Erwinia sp. S59]
MDEFKPEDELKPDASDRRPTRPRKTSSAPKAKVPVSRQHMMMGIGILVLLLVVLGIGSALTGPDDKKPANTASNGNAAPTATGGEKNIDLSGSTSMSGQQSATPSVDAPQTPATSSSSAGGDSNSISMPAVSSTPTQAAPVDTPANQQRVTLPGDLNSALSNQQGQVDNAAQGAQGNSSLPTAPATVSGNGKAMTPPAMRSETPARTNSNGSRETHSNTAHKAPTTSKPAAGAKENKTHTTAAHNAPVSASSGASKSLPTGGSYTLQLSGASKEESLNAWAKKQNLSGYHVYKTTRNGQPWYVLVSGAYATPADAKRAVASLPAEVRAANPWVKPLSQVKKESQ